MPPRDEGRDVTVPGFAGSEPVTPPVSTAAPAVGEDNPTPEQWEVIRCTDEHVLVAAGAGTGKTFTVIAKILYLLGVEVSGRTIDRPLRLSDIAAITFTNQAAAELKERLRTKLRAAGRRDLAYEVDLARVGTIHSFCGEILRDFALRTGRPPAGRVLEEGEGSGLAADVVQDALVEALETGAAPGLEALLSTRSARDVQAWVTILLGRSDRLDVFRQAAAEDGPEAALLALTRLAARRLHERLAALGAVDFDRMIGWTRELLDDNAVCAALRRRIRVLIVDEFQDTDPLQQAIAYRLADPGSGRRDTTRLVLVGDPKQSIFRFRRADVTVWNAVADDFEGRGLGRVLPLAENRRSLPGILAFVDATIGRALAAPVAGETLQGFEVPPQPLRAVRQGGGGETVVELLLTPAGEDGKAPKAELGRRIEAEGIAARMLELHGDTAGEANGASGVAAGPRDATGANRAAAPAGSGEAKGADGPAGERFAWSEMALLLASWSAVDLYEAALQRRGIPCYVLRSDGFYDRTEVTDLLLALEAIRDPTDDRALLGFLRSPFVGVTDETLLRVAMQLRSPYWRGLGGVETGEAGRIRGAIALLERFGALRDRVPVAELAEDLLHESGYLAHLALLPGDGEQAIANVRRFLDLVRAAPEATLGDVLRRIRAQRERGDRVPQARLYGEKDDVVLITSIHSAKGLEWRAVFWADLGRMSKAQYDDLQVGRDRLVVGDPDAHHEHQSEAWTALQQRDDAERRAEAKRLWYVAATRAKDLLVLSGLPAGTGARISGSPAEMLLGALAIPPQGGPLPYVGAEGQAHVARVTILGEDAVAAAADGAAAAIEKPVGDAAILPPPLEALAAAAGRGRHSATELMVFQTCQRRHWYRYIAGVREPSPGGTGPAWRSAAVRGQVVHDVLEHLLEEEDADRLLEDAIERYAPDAPADDVPAGSRYRAALRAEVEKVATHPSYRALADHPLARAELPFLLVLDEGRYGDGFIDLAAPGETGLRLLDVKTGRTPPGEAAAKYAAQRDVYVTAAGEIGGRPVEEFLLAFSRAGAVEGTRLTPAEHIAARERFVRSVASMEAGTRALAADPDTCFGCGYRAIGLCEGARARG